MKNNLNDNQNIGFATVFSVAAVWFGAHVGGGFATGNQTRTFFVKFGFTSIFLPFIIVALIGFIYYEGLLFARNNNEYNYHNWIEKLYAPYGKIPGYIFDIAYLLLTIVAVGASIAGSAELFRQLLQIDYYIGVIATGVIFFFLTIFGANLVRKASSIITILILIFLSIITIAGIKANPSTISSLFAAKQLNAPISTILYNGLIYAGFQSLVLAIMLGSSEPLKTKKSIRDFTILGVLLNGVMITMTCLMMLLWLPLIEKETLPIFTILKQLDSNFLIWSYSITLFSAFVSTGVGCIFGIVARYEKTCTIFKDITKVRMLISSSSMIVSVMLSFLGLNTLIIKGYGYLGIISIFFLIIPTIVLGIIKNSKFK